MKYASYELDQISDVARRSVPQNYGRQQFRFGDQMLVTGDDAMRSVRDAGARVAEARSLSESKQLFLVRQKGRLFESSFPDVEIVHDGGRFLAVGISEQEHAEIRKHGSHCFEIGPLPENGIVFERRPHSAARHQPQQWLQDLVDKVSADAFHLVLKQLVSFPTRHAHSDHYASAATACVELFTNLGYETRLQEVPLGSQMTSNVIAEKRGTGNDRALVIGMAHLDSININGTADSSAPGADDNGSGSAGVLEIARVLQDHSPLHDLRLVLFGGEELGLFGSKHYVSVLEPHDKARLASAINMDMIACRNLARPAVLIEAAEQAILDELSNAADAFTTLTIETSLNPFASDHVPFIHEGLPAALTIEGADSNNTNIHTANDVVDHIDNNLASEIIRMNVGYIANKLGSAGAK